MPVKQDIRGSWLQKLMSYIKQPWGEDGCWLLKDPKKKFIKIPGSRIKEEKEAVRKARAKASIGTTVSIKKALYASTVGKIDEGKSLSVSNSCQSGCHNPRHQTLVPAKFISNALELIPLLDVLDFTSAQRDKRPDILPKGWERATVLAVKHWMREGRGVKAVAAMSHLKEGDVMAILNGVYDLALENMERSAAVGRGRGEDPIVRVKDPTTGNYVVADQEEVRRYANEELDRMARERSSQSHFIVTPRQPRVSEDQPKSPEPVQPQETSLVHYGPNLVVESPVHALDASVPDVVKLESGASPLIQLDATPKRPPVTEKEDFGVRNADGSVWEPPEVTDEEVWLHWQKNK